MSKARKVDEELLKAALKLSDALLDYECELDSEEEFPRKLDKAWLNLTIAIEGVREENEKENRNG